MMSLVALAGSMAPVNGIVMRGCVENPSSSLITTMSAHSTARASVLVQSAGVGRLTRRNVLLPQSRTVKRSLGNGVADGSLLLKRTETPALAPTATLANAAASANRLKANASDMFVSGSFCLRERHSRSALPLQQAGGFANSRDALAPGEPSMTHAASARARRHFGDTRRRARAQADCNASCRRAAGAAR